MRLRLSHCMSPGDHIQQQLGAQQFLAVCSMWLAYMLPIQCKLGRKRKVSGYHPGAGVLPCCYSCSVSPLHGSNGVLGATGHAEVGYLVCGIEWAAVVLAPPHRMRGPAFMGVYLSAVVSAAGGWVGTAEGPVSFASRATLTCPWALLTAVVPFLSVMYVQCLSLQYRQVQWL